MWVIGMRLFDMSLAVILEAVLYPDERVCLHVSLAVFAKRPGMFVDATAMRMLCINYKASQLY